MIKTKQNSKGNQNKTMENFKRKSIASFFIMLFVVSIFSPMVTVTAQPALESVSITPSTPNINVTENITFNAIHIPYNATLGKVIWSVINKSGKGIINDTSGLFTALSAGTVNVIARSGNVSGNTIVDIMEQNITLSAPESINIKPDTTTIDINATQQFTATILPESANQNVTWHVDNESVGTINETGFFTALSAGTVNVTATSVVNTNIIRNAIVIVKKQPVPPSINILPDTAIVRTNMVRQFTAEVLPEGVNQTINWTVDNTSVGTINETGFFTALSAGTVNVTATSVVYTNITGTANIIVKEAQELVDVAIITPVPGIAHLFDSIPIEDRPVNFETYVINSRLITETLGCPEFNLTAYDLVIVNIGRPSAWTISRRLDPLRPFLQNASDAGVPIVFTDFIYLVEDEYGNKHIDPRISGLTTISLEDIYNVRTLRDYIENAIIPGNLINSLRFGYVHFLGGQEVYDLPQIMPIPGIYHPMHQYMFFNNTADYIDWATETGRFDIERPTIGILATRWSIRSGNTRSLDALINEIEGQGVNVIAAYPYSVWRNPEQWEFDLFYLEGERLIDAAITTSMCIPLTPYRREAYYELGVQILAATVAVGMTPDEWRDYGKGLPLAMMGWAVPGIEYSGFISPTVISGRIDELDVPIPEQIERIVARAINHAELVRTPNEDKRVAIIYFDYGVARTCKVTRGLNKPQSIINVLNAMYEHGFNVDKINETEFTKLRYKHGKTIPLYAQPKLDAMVANHSKEIVLIPISEYRNWLQEMIPACRIEEVIQFWGEPEDGNMVVNYNGKPHIVLPMIKRGNVILLPEPGPCGGTVNETIVFHDVGPTPPHHHRIAFYLWLQRENIDAVVSLSIGTYAALPGRERALSPDCWPFLLSGHIPFVRPYSTDSSALAMKNRRRGDMVVIGHMQAPIIMAGQYGSLGALRDAIFSYREIIEGPVRDAERPHIIERAIEINFDRDMGMPGFEGVPHDAALIDRIERHLEKFRTTMISGGLHTLGEIPNRIVLSETIMFMLGPTFINEINMVGGVEDKRTSQTKAIKLLMAVFNNTTAYNAQRNIFGNTSPILTDLLDEGKKHYQNFHDSREIEAIIDVLEGRFVMPGPSGNQIHNPETIPTGRHLYTFDPRRFPTRGAWDVGKETLGQMLFEYNETHGTFPDKLSFILWASETKRHRGVVESQILYAMGVRPVWDRRGRVRIDGGRRGLEIIPDNELGRPRIDISAIITGTYRNTFPCRVKVIDTAVRLVAAHEEDGQINHVRRNYLDLKSDFTAQNMTDEMAHELAAARIFGPPLEELGARIGGIMKASLTDDRAMLADLFINQFAHIYTSKSWGITNEYLIRRALSGTDVALFSRSSPRVGLIGGVCCCAAAFLGGLSMAIERIDGAPPQTMITNLRDAFNPGIVTTNEFLRSELRTTLTNPRWIENMMAEGYSGAREMKHIINHMWVWESATPYIITEDMWNDVYEIFMMDRYNLNIEEFFERYHPHAMQSNIARLLEVINAGEWNADDSIIQKLTERYIESVANHGKTCLAAQCANIRLDQFIAEQIAEQIRTETLTLSRETINRFNLKRRETLEENVVDVPLPDLPADAHIKYAIDDDAGVEPPKAVADAQAEPIELPGVDVGVDAPAEPTPAEPASVEPMPAEVAPDAHVVEGAVIEPVAPVQPAGKLILPVTEIAIGIVLIGLIGAAYMFFKKKD